ncbi:MAG: hypothetical protein KJN78_11660 [Gammaproteobacteria bacterium]|nr:hypothetical protein [Gammaproteobacteria bacterium]NNK34067.1 hypothetical protein [Xanthomonadales bacterium]
MHAISRRETGLFTLLVTFMMAAPMPVTVEAEWEIRQFEVFAGAPYQRDDGLVEMIGFDWAEAEDWFSNINRAEVEQAFNDAAAWYSTEGFPEPMIEPIVQTDNGPAYRIYVCSEELMVSTAIYNFWEWIKTKIEWEGDIPNWASCGAWGAYNGACARSKGARTFFYLNADGPAFDSDGKLTVKGYQTVAHELFHAIQGNTVMGNSPEPCEIGKWIGEGQADAVSMDLLDEKWPGITQPTSDSWISKKRGVRPFNKKLTEDAQGYTTSSFWRFLGDLNGGYDFFMTAPDGSPGVFDFEIQEAGDWRSEVSWLDAGLYSRFNMNLNEILGLFFNDYSMRIPPQSWTSGNANDDGPRWVKGILGECEEITLSGRKTSHEFFMRIEPIAGGCAWLTVNVPQATAQVSLQTASADVSLFKDIWIGLAEGDAILTQGMMAGKSPVDPSRNLGIWADFTVRSGFPTLLTFTNAANQPENSERRVVNFEISMNSSTNNLRGPAPAGPGKAAKPAAKPSYKKHTKTLQQKQTATATMVTEQKNLDKEALTPFTSMSNSIAMRPRQPACQDPFKYTACGPSTSINMELMPGTWANLGQSAGTGGMAGQVFSSMMGQALSNPLDSTQVMQGLQARLESIDGSSVSIVVPFIDYGFTGSVNNASISTTVGGQHMSAFGPPDANGNTLLTGRVTIETFTPFRLTGSYSAQLAYFEEPPGPDQPPIYRQGPSLNGTFNQVAPWLSDARVQPIQLQSKEEMADDIGKALGIPASTMRSLREQGSIPGGSGPTSAPAGSSGGGSMGGDCNCDCANKGKVDELCEFFCEEEFAKCP